jgi:hypothetical protein
MFSLHEEHTRIGGRVVASVAAVVSELRQRAQPKSVTLDDDI